MHFQISQIIVFCFFEMKTESKRNKVSDAKPINLNSFKHWQINFNSSLRFESVNKSFTDGSKLLNLWIQLFRHRDNIKALALKQISALSNHIIHINCRAAFSKISTS